MERLDNTYRILVTLGGTFATFLFGGDASMLKVLLAFVVIDYLTGVLASGVEGKLKSAIGIKGIARKVFIFTMVMVANLADQSFGSSHVFRDATIWFYLANEVLSIIENAGRVGLPIPGMIKQAVEVLRKKSEGGL